MPARSWLGGRSPRRSRSPPGRDGAPGNPRSPPVPDSAARLPARTGCGTGRARVCRSACPRPRGRRLGRRRAGRSRAPVRRPCCDRSPRRAGRSAPGPSPGRTPRSERRAAAPGCRRRAGVRCRSAGWRNTSPAPRRPRTNCACPGTRLRRGAARTAPRRRRSSGTAAASLCLCAPEQPANSTTTSPATIGPRRPAKRIVRAQTTRRASPLLMSARLAIEPRESRRLCRYPRWRT